MTNKSKLLLEQAGLAREILHLAHLAPPLPVTDPTKQAKSLDSTKIEYLSFSTVE